MVSVYVDSATVISIGRKIQFFFISEEFLPTRLARLTLRFISYLAEKKPDQKTRLVKVTGFPLLVGGLPAGSGRLRLAVIGNVAMMRTIRTPRLSRLAAEMKPGLFWVTHRP